MSGFSADWLALREPYDLRARNPAVLDAVVTWCKDMFAIRVVDLGCGTGSTLRALTPRLPGRQNWRLVRQRFRPISPCGGDGASSYSNSHGYAHSI